MTVAPTGASDPLAALLGTYRLGSRVQMPNGSEEPIDLGTLRVFSAVRVQPEAEPGQWLLAMDPDTAGTHRMSFFIEAASRLELLPVRLASSFERVLRAPEPLCLVADTNALYHGTLAQALRLRAGRATHVAIADTAMMELQRQRERAWHMKIGAPIPAGSGADGQPDPPTARETAAIERWARTADRARFLAAAGRVLRRLRASGHVVHIARPPAAMVRYFGGSKGAGDGEEPPGDDIVGSNALRDRLILEAASQQRVDVPGVRVVLVTDDALLAEQAQIEGLLVGFGWKATEMKPALLTSPFINPRTLQLMHVSVPELLDELLWSCSILTLHREGEGRMLMGKVPDHRRDRFLAMQEEGYAIAWSSVKADLRASSQTQSAVGIPRKAPPALRLLERLLSWCQPEDGATQPGEPEGDEEARTADAYLRALGWLADAGTPPRPTDRGVRLAAAWRRLAPDDVPEWVTWMLDAGADLARLPPLKELVQLLRTHPGATDEDLSKLAGRHQRTVSAQLGLAGAFGQLVRLNAKNWCVETWTAEEADEAVLEAIATRAGRNTSGIEVASVARVFTYFLDRKPMPLPVFRGALSRLRASHRVRFSGSSPEASGVKMRVLVPSDQASAGQVVARDIDLGHGDFLLPGTPAGVAEIATEQQ